MAGWIIFSLLIALLFIVDLFWICEKRLTLKRALLWSACSIGIAIFFGLWIWVYQGATSALNYYTGYLIEKFLSLDNLFVFLLIFQGLQIPEHYWHRVLLLGILGAIATRILFIFFGIYLVEHFHSILYLFGAFLFFTGLKLAFASEKSLFFDQNSLLLWLEKKFPVTKECSSGRFFQRQKGKLVMTPLFLALLAIESSDLLFALDSIPAIFAITTDPFLVYTSNIFAVLGMRTLFFALVGLASRFRSFHIGISLVLLFVGFKLLAAPWLTVPPFLSLLIILFLLALSFPLARKKI